MRLTISTTLFFLISLLLIATLCNSSSDEVLYKSVEDQMRETLQLAEKYPNATPAELATILGSTHGRGFKAGAGNKDAMPVTAGKDGSQKQEQIDPKSVDSNKGTNQATQSGSTLPPSTKSTQPTPTKTATTSPPTTTTTASKLPSTEGQTTTQQQPQRTKPVTTTAIPKSTTTTTDSKTVKSSTTTTTPKTTTTTPPADPGHGIAFVLILLFLIAAFIAVVYVGYTKWREMNDEAGLYQPLSRRDAGGIGGDNDDDGTDIEFDDIESGAGSIPIDHGSIYDEQSDLEALDSITTGKHMLNGKLFQEQKSGKGNNSGFGYQEVLLNSASTNSVVPNYQQPAVTLQHKPPQNIQSDQVIDVLDDKKQSPQDNNNNNDQDEFESWDSISTGSGSSSNLASPRFNALDDLESFNTTISTTPTGGRGGLNNTNTKPTLTPDTLSLGAMLGASYAGADSRIKTPSNRLQTTTNTSNPTTSPRPQVVMKDPATRGQDVHAPRTLITSTITPKQSTGASTPPTKFTSFSPLAVNPSTLTTVVHSTTPLSTPPSGGSQGQNSTMGGANSSNNQNFIDTEDAIFGASSPTILNTTTLSNNSSTASTVKNDMSTGSGVSAFGEMSLQQQPLQPKQSTDEFNFDLGGIDGGDDDDWFQDVPDTSTAMDLIQKSNSLLSGLDLDF